MARGIAKRFLTSEKKRELLRMMNEETVIASTEKKQQRTRTQPFQNGTLRCALFDMLRGVTTMHDVRALCAKVGGSFYVSMKIMRRGYANGYIWDYHETTAGKLWIDNIESASSLLQRNKRFSRTL
jgi:hypothetical protein